ncbi:MAG: hypothetical protein JRI22_18550 [Deltaproteobacteria bacterium]|nr:hypothetical protein [Deltaproteobacteria bacterium]
MIGRKSRDSSQRGVRLLALAGSEDQECPQKTLQFRAHRAADAPTPASLQKNIGLLENNVTAV